MFGALCGRAPVASGAVVVGVLAGVASANPWADSVVSYEAGTNPSGGYTNPQTVLGSPERFTGEGVFPGAVTPFNSPFGSDEIVSIGAGEHLTVKFDQPVTNDPLNPFGIDLLIFGNAFLFDSGGTAGGVADEEGVIEVSVNGTVWHTVPGSADGNFSTLGYLDLTSRYQSTPGSVESDFLLPVDPSFDPIGKTFEQIVAGYNGSGGGKGVDLSVVGLDEISYVRISTPAGASLTPEIDAFADVRAVPSPGAAGLLLIGGLAGALKRRRVG